MFVNSKITINSSLIIYLPVINDGDYEVLPRSVSQLAVYNVTFCWFVTLCGLWVTSWLFETANSMN